MKPETFRDTFQAAADGMARARLTELRDMFAAAALPACYSELARQVGEGELAGFGWGDVATSAYVAADALLKVRGVQSPSSVNTELLEALDDLAQRYYRTLETEGVDMRDIDRVLGRARAVLSKARGVQP